MLLAGAAAELDAGNVRGGFEMLCRAMRYRPFVIFNPKLVAGCSTFETRDDWPSP